MIWVNVSLAHHFYAGLSADDGVTIEVVEAQIREPGKGSGMRVPSFIHSVPRPIQS